MTTRLPHTVVKKDGDIPFASITNLYDFFSPRSKNITVWSFGFANAGVEIDIAESTGAKIQIFDARPGTQERYDIFERIMAKHASLPDDPAWATSLTNYWIVPNSTSFSSTLPWAYSGNLLVDGVPTEVKATDAERVDILKVDYGTFTTDILYTLLNKGYRPGLIYIRWDTHPDESNTTMACAGHLQTLGYRLLKSVDNYFLYLYMDDCMYELCSWSRTDTNNPMFEEYRRQLLEGMQIGGK
jgi:hypothetical protein